MIKTMFQRDWLTRPVPRQDSSPDIAHFVSGKLLVRDLDFDTTWGFICSVCVCVWVGGGGAGGIALCKIFIKLKMNQTGDKVRK